MRHLTRLAVTGAVAGLAVSACGGSSNVLQGKTPTQIIQLAGTSISSSSYHMTLHGTVDFDAGGITGLPPAALSQMTAAMKNLAMDGGGDVQSAKRAKFSMTMKPTLSTTAQMVLYDDHVYMSEDGGKTWSDMGSFNFNGLPISPGDAAGILKDVGNAQDQGGVVRNGTKVEHMHAIIPADYVQKQIGNVGGTGQLGKMIQQLGSVMAGAMKVRDGALDAYVRQSDGRLDSMEAHMTVAIDMQKFLEALMQALGGSLPPGAAGSVSGVSGTLNMNVVSNQTFSNYGEKVTIEKPTVDPKAPAPSGLLGA
jgi:hypothetical protein